jgi:putative ABC transport system substrate-binding protein
LISYGADQVDSYRRAAGYIDCILKGEKPANMPVHAPVKYALVIDLKTAKALGLDVPPTLIACADGLIERRFAVLRASLRAPRTGTLFDWETTEFSA